MPSRLASILTSLAILGTASLSAQQATTGARLVKVDGRATLNGQPIAPGAPAITLGDVTDFQTTAGRMVIALTGSGTLVLGENTSARLQASRIEMLAGSAVLLSATSSPLVACGTEAQLASGGVFRFDVLSPEQIDGTQRCRVRVHEGVASTAGPSVSYVARTGQEMIMNTRAGDMIPVNRTAAGALDELDRWAREQAGLPR